MLRRWLRHKVLIGGLAALLALQPQPAQAGILEDAIRFIAAPLLATILPLPILTGALAALETHLAYAVGEFEAEVDIRLARARDQALERTELASEHARIRTRFAGDPTESACTAATTNRALERSQYAAANTQSTLTSDMQQARVPTTQAGGPMSEVQRAAADQCAAREYALPSELAAMQAMGCPTPAAAPVAGSAAGGAAGGSTVTNPAAANQPVVGAIPGGDRVANLLLDADAFNDEAHMRATMRFCYNLTSNRTVSQATGQALTGELDNQMHYMHHVRPAHARLGLATYECNRLIARRMPMDNRFASGTGAQPFVCPAARSGNADLNQLTKCILMGENDEQRQQAGMFTEVPRPTTPVSVSDPRTIVAANRQFVLGQQASVQQLDYAVLNRQSSLTASQQAGGVGERNAVYQNLIFKRIAALQLAFRQYEALERQLLMEATFLALKAQKQVADPVPVTN